MQIWVNDSALDISEKLTISELIARLDKSPSGIAVAINQEIQPRTCWDSRVLQSGDNVLLFQAIAGG